MKDKFKEEMPKFYGAVVVGERGQIVIPAEARHDMEIISGDKLIILGGFHGTGLMIIKRETISELLSKSMEHMSLFESMLKEDDEPPK
ncbi:MAG: AbrB/MazE/SpoVT family DNA-binding domain-containing protein [Dehalococcoidales bacterium]|nr:AbrB/MazE/SpoVT family DNA-binding domain-containing protein [Dehalococcoidales bacterium]